jgi:integrase
MSRKKQKRGRYGDGCVYRQKGRRIYWISWYEPMRQANGTIEHVRRFLSTGTEDKKIAQCRLRAKLQLVGSRRPTIADPNKVMYEDLRANFMQYCQMNNLRSLKKNREGDPTLNTLPRLDRFFATWRANEITVAQLKRFRIEGHKDGLSDTRVNRYMATLRKMFNQAIKDELITQAERPAYFPTTHESSEASGALFVEPQWYEPLRKALKEPLRSAFTLAYHTSTRVGELQRIRWRDISNGVLTLTATHTKTGKSRTVGIPQDFDLKPGKPDVLVFPLGDCRERWRTACVKVGAGYYECRQCQARGKGRVCPAHGKQPTKRLRYRGLTLRHTRHTAARNMSDAGLDSKRIMERTGHVTRSMLDRYNIGKETDARRTSDLMDEFHRRQQRSLLANVNQTRVNRSKRK